MRTLLICLFTLSPVFFMGDLSAQQKTISGKLTGFQNGEKVVLYDPELMKNLDSTTVQNGTFKLKNPLGNVPKTIYLTINYESDFIMFIAGENIEVFGDKSRFKYGSTLKGSKFQKERELLYNQTQNYHIERDSLEKYFDDGDGSKAYKELQQIKQARIKEIDKGITAITVKYIKEHTNNYMALEYLFDYVDEFSKEEIQNIYTKADKDHQESSYGKRIKMYLEIGKILREGDAYYDFEAKDQNGKAQKISEIKDKFILLDFMETYCGPCMESVKELKKVASEYKGQLQVISFCGDKPEDIWRKGLNRDKPEWPSLWDGKGASGPVPTKYGSNGYPTFVLIDRNGIIQKIEYGYEKGIIEKMLKENIKI